MKSTRDALTLWVKHFFDFYSSRSHSAWQQGQKFQWHWTLFPHSETICAFLSPKKLRHSKQIHQQLPLNLPPLLTKQAQHRVHYFLFFSFSPSLSLSFSTLQTSRTLFGFIVQIFPPNICQLHLNHTHGENLRTQKRTLTYLFEIQSENQPRTTKKESTRETKRVIEQENIVPKVRLESECDGLE